MSREKRRKEEAPMPSVSAGLLRFYEEESFGVKVRPEVIVFAAVILILTIALVHLFFR